MLSSDQKDILNTVDKEIYRMFHQEHTGHDYYHIKRVVDLTARLMPSDDPEYFLALMIAYCHDVFDDKINPSHDLHHDFKVLFTKWGINVNGLEEAIINGVQEIGYKGGFGVKSKSHAATFVSDADLLDAMGAVGIARTFYYAGSKGQHFHDPSLEFTMPDSLESYRKLNRNPIDHFNEKLLLLKDWIVTEPGKREAIKRHATLQQFYDDFIREVNLSE